MICINIIYIVYIIDIIYAYYPSLTLINVFGGKVVGAEVEKVGPI